MGNGSHLFPTYIIKKMHSILVQQHKKVYSWKCFALESEDSFIYLFSCSLSCSATFAYIFKLSVFLTPQAQWQVHDLPLTQASFVCNGSNEVPIRMTGLYLFSPVEVSGSHRHKWEKSKRAAVKGHT